LGPPSPAVPIDKTHSATFGRAVIQIHELRSESQPPQLLRLGVEYPRCFSFTLFSPDRQFYIQWNSSNPLVKPGMGGPMASRSGRKLSCVENCRAAQYDLFHIY
jgi:hypothetical protein